MGHLRAPSINDAHCSESTGPPKSSLNCSTVGLQLLRLDENNARERWGHNAIHGGVDLNHRPVDYSRYSMLLKRLSLSCVSHHGFAGSSGLAVPFLFPSRGLNRYGFRHSPLLRTAIHLLTHYFCSTRNQATEYFKSTPFRHRLDRRLSWSSLLGILQHCLQPSPVAVSFSARKWC